MKTTSARQQTLIDKAKIKGNLDPITLIARNEVEVKDFTLQQKYKLYFKAIRVRPGGGMTSVIYQVIPHRPDSRPENAPTVPSPLTSENGSEHPEGTYNQTTEVDSQSRMSVTSDNAPLIPI